MYSKEYTKVLYLRASCLDISRILYNGKLFLDIGKDDAKCHQTVNSTYDSQTGKHLCIVLYNAAIVYP